MEVVVEVVAVAVAARRLQRRRVGECDLDRHEEEREEDEEAHQQVPAAPLEGVLRDHPVVEPAAARFDVLGERVHAV